MGTRSKPSSNDSLGEKLKQTYKLEAHARAWASTAATDGQQP